MSSSSVMTTLLKFIRTKILFFVNSYTYLSFNNMDILMMDTEIVFSHTSGDVDLRGRRIEY